MIEHELTVLADRLATPVATDLTEQVLARIDQVPRRSGHSPGRVRAWVAAGLTAAVATSFLSPQVRAFAADLLGVAGIEISSDVPDAPSEPRAPLPEVRETSLQKAQAQVDFPLLVPARLGPPDTVDVADGGRVVTMTWQGGRLVLDQFAARLGPVFSKHVGGVAAESGRVFGRDAWWLPEAHDLTYVDRDGNEVTATARLAGPSLVWEGPAGVTLRLEGARLARDRALAIARSVQ